ncbi:MAG: cysteine--tRNA ligase [Thermoplasmatota archaeon]
MVLKVYNTQSRSKEEFQPQVQGKVSMYVCGPTVYDNCHVGHARSYVAFDVIRRYLEYRGYTVIYVQNFTDVDDKIISRSAESGVPPLVLSERFIQEYFADMDKLGVRRATVHPKASEVIPDMITVVKGLIEKGYAYEVNGSVYFEVEKARDIFGKLRHQSLDDMKDGARIEIDSDKRSPKDFALWKSAKHGEISWDSPWGMGRPGWHIECSTMSTKYLGPTLDIHGGGMDLIFPHHESEILQSECYNEVPFVKYWLHNGFVEIDSEKMSKSLKNFFTIKEVTDKFDPMVVRFFLVYTHYRSPIDFSDAALEEASRSFGRLKKLHRSLSETVGPLEDGAIPDFGSPGEDVLNMVFSVKKEFMDSMDDDFNTRIAVACLFRLDSEVRSLQNKGEVGRADSYVILSMMNELSSILGLDYSDDDAGDDIDSGIVRDLMQLLIDIRSEARTKKDWRTADSIRDRLKGIGIVLEDGDNTTWHLEK